MRFREHARAILRITRRHCPSVCGGPHRARSRARAPGLRLYTRSCVVIEFEIPIFVVLQTIDVAHASKADARALLGRNGCRSVSAWHVSRRRRAIVSCCCQRDSWQSIHPNRVPLTRQRHHPRARLRIVERLAAHLATIDGDTLQPPADASRQYVALLQAFPRLVVNAVDHGTRTNELFVFALGCVRRIMRAVFAPASVVELECATTAI